MRYCHATLHFKRVIGRRLSTVGGPASFGMQHVMPIIQVSGNNPVLLMDWIISNITGANSDLNHLQKPAGKP